MGERNKILIICSDASDLVILNHILQRDYTIFSAKSGEMAIRSVVEETPDLVLLDVVLPGMSGLKMLGHLKELSVTRDIPVIVMAEDSDGDKEKIIEQAIVFGAADCVTKPFNDIIVKARVNTHLQIACRTRAMERTDHVDSLTDIPNLKKFDDHLAQEWRRAFREKKPLAFLKLGVDKLSEYNDVHGYSHGDTLLKTVAQISASVAKRPTDLAARLGGEEFGILLPDTDLDGAMTVAEKIRGAVEIARMSTADNRVLSPTTVSIGATSWIPSNGGTTLDFIAKANENLDAAKNAGRNKVVGTNAIRAYAHSSEHERGASTLRVSDF